MVETDIFRNDVRVGLKVGGIGDTNAWLRRGKAIHNAISFCSQYFGAMFYLQQRGSLYLFMLMGRVG